MISCSRPVQQFLLLALLFVCVSPVIGRAAPPVHPGWPSTDAVNIETPVAADVDGDGRMEFFGEKCTSCEFVATTGLRLPVGRDRSWAIPPAAPSVGKLNSDAVIGMWSLDSHSGG